MAKLFSKNFATRIISALIIAGPAVACIHFGGFPFIIFITLVSTLMAWEWSRLCQDDKPVVSYILMAFCFFLPISQLLDIPLSYILGTSPLIAAIIYTCNMSRKGRKILALGVFYISLPIAAFLFLRSVPEIGMELVYWMVGIVIATDTGGYIFGICIGGPKLAPKISPKKTWAGLIGAMLSALGVGLLCSHIFEWNDIYAIAALSACMAVIAQSGDLLESHVKRYFEVKDSSNIIPGHGGVLDRVDGMLAAGCGFVGLVLLSQGALLSWF